MHQNNCKTSLVVLHSQNYVAGICRHYQKSSNCFEYAKKSLLNQATQKILKLKPKNILGSSPSLQIRSIPPLPLGPEYA